MTFLQARTANEVLKAQERRLRLQQLKGELVDRARAVEPGVPPRPRRARRLERLAGADRRRAGGRARLRHPPPADRPGPPCPRAPRPAGRAPPRAPLSPTVPPPWPGPGREGLRPEPALSVADLGRPAPRALAARLGRARPLAHRAHALPRRDHGRPVAEPPGAADRVHEGCPGRRHRGRQQLAGLPDPPRPGPGAGGAADGRAGQALLAPAGRHPDRGDPGPARAGDPGPQPRQRQHRAHQGIPRRHPGDDRCQQCGRPALAAGPLPVPGRGRRLPGQCRRGGRSGGPGRGPDADLRPPAQDLPGLDPDHPGRLADRARVPGQRPAPVLRALPALRGHAVAALRAAALGQGPARDRRLLVRGLRAADRRAAQGADAARPAAGGRPPPRPTR